MYDKYSYPTTSGKFQSTSCPHCKKFAVGMDSIHKEFGFRIMDGVVRVQSWCRECRCHNFKEWN